MEQLIARLNDVVAGVAQGHGTAGQLLTDTALADETQQLLTRANELMGELQGVATNPNVAVKSVRNGTARLPEITAAAAHEAQALPGLVLQTQVSMRQIERLVEALQRHWLLRRYVNKTNPPPLRPLPETAVPETKPVKALPSPKDSARWAR